MVIKVTPEDILKGVFKFIEVKRKYGLDEKKTKETGTLRFYGLSVLDPVIMEIDFKGFADYLNEKLKP